MRATTFREHMTRVASAGAVPVPRCIDMICIYIYIYIYIHASQAQALYQFHAFAAFSTLDDLAAQLNRAPGRDSELTRIGWLNRAPGWLGPAARLPGAALALVLCVVCACVYICRFLSLPPRLSPPPSLPASPPFSLSLSLSLSLSYVKGACANTNCSLSMYVCTHLSLSRVRA